ncbi:DUF192 domain-containing protein [Salinibaculum rarum]|uniref:DUF192 domain-containing protein n=1 Tax=Salinibaculum rarum TaxID=3058903 RepID=UPI00265F209C|nr:DUF192 domain-containing protein [Salinibaculum sp. KK48]
MRVVHRQDEVLGSDESPTDRVLASTVELADSTLSQAKGLMFRSSIPDDFALVMEVDGSGGLFSLTDGPPRQFVHMLFMRFPIDVLWLDGDRVVETAQLSPWTGFGVASADRIIELPAGATEGVTPGDTVLVEGIDDTDE